ncbi:MAG: bifunctional glutamate N-acetyltransferase/amino-acid acetyltransferase ArgJ [Lentisphaeria bacterium]|nr:bifunctional glutamate N-acetyltransferase/amino-acid acetyltransferase ArgJ [Lentisphaeria bacterium]
MNNNILWLENGSVSSPSGFKASGVTAGFKKSGAADCAMIFSELPCSAAGAFTSCVFAAAPVRVCQEKLAKHTPIHACFINSGNANACTGENGMENARKTCRMVAEALSINEDSVLVSSTGRIGVQMPMDTVAKGVTLSASALSADGGVDASKAIMTTDTVNKSVALELTLPEGKVRIGAMTKGAGMIDPAMKVLHATMLCYITTDADVQSVDLQKILDKNIECSFNRITVDGDMSTNDTTILMANGASKVKLAYGTESFEIFSNAVLEIMQSLARQMVMDGEGVTKFVEVKIVNAKNYDDAKKLAEAVANSLLCKTAWFGCDPNWGRVVAALGYSGVDFNPDLVNIYYDGIPVVRDGGDAGTPEEDLADVMKKREFTVLCDMNCGDVDYWVWTGDVTYEYVKINADYHT